MPDPNNSPAVQSLNQEKAKQRTDDNDVLDQGLEDTFPASDPISATQSSTASSIDTKLASEHGGEDYPLVEEALRSTGETGGETSGRVRELRREATRVSDQASEVAIGAATLGKAEAKSVLRSVEDMVRERPLTAVGIVAAVAWLWGATR